MEIGNYTIPLSSLGWIVGGVAMWMFSWRNWRHAKETANPIARLNALWTASFGFTCFTALTPIFTLDPTILMISFDIATFWTQLTIVIIAYLMWFAWLRPYMPSWVLLTPVVILSVCILVLTIMTTGIKITEEPLVIENTNLPIVGFLAVALYNVVAQPAGIWMLISAYRSKTWQARLKSSVIGLTICLLVGTFSLQLLLGEAIPAMLYIFMAVAGLCFTALALVLIFLPKQKISK